MRALLILGACATLGACVRKVPEAEPQPAATEAASSSAAGYSVSPYTLARICPDGTKIYGPQPYAMFESNSWVQLEPGVDPARVC